MIIGVLRESRPGEARVAATPATVVELVKLGYEVVVEPGAGLAASFSDEAYVEAGAVIGEATAATSCSRSTRRSSDWTDCPGAPR